MGYYRLILAFMVAASHAGLTFGRYNPGEIAVVSFFLLSGYVMTALIERHYPDLRSAGWFYLDRALRLYPQFLFYSLATILGAEIFGLRHLWMSAPPTLASDLVQLTMLPLNFTERFPNMLMPQAWSLGLELMFYFVFPFILIPMGRMGAAYASALVFLFAFWGRLPADWFAYRLLPGVLFVFVLGSWIRKPGRLGPWPVVFFFALATAALMASLTILPRRASVCDMLIGLVAGLPIVYALARVHLSGRWEKLAGDLSYGVFLNHMLLLPILARLIPETSSALRFVLLIPVSVALSYATFRWIETPVIAMRRNLRSAPARPAAPVKTGEVVAMKGMSEPVIASAAKQSSVVRTSRSYSSTDAHGAAGLLRSARNDGRGGPGESALRSDRAQSRSTIVTLAMPPPSHIVCKP